VKAAGAASPALAAGDVRGRSGTSETDALAAPADDINVWSAMNADRSTKIGKTHLRSSPAKTSTAAACAWTDSSMPSSTSK
jgi:hypothetical protein